MPTRRRDNRRTIAFLGLSALVHVHVVLVIVAVLSLKPEGCAHQDVPLSPLEVDLVPTDATKVAVTPKQLDKEEEKEKKKEDQDDKGQVVELPPPLEEKRPDKARFRSEYDSKVARETKSRVPFKPGKIVAARPVRIPRKASAPTPKELRRVARKVMKLAMRTRPELPKSDLPPSKTGDQPARRAKVDPAPKGPRRDASQPSGPKQRKLPTLKELQLSEKELARALGTPVNDALKNVPDGTSTLLNSKRWRFASFFNRVKRQVAQNWHPDRAYRRRDPSGNVYGFRDRLTILRVQLTPQGKLKALHVEKACGVGFLDDEAIAAFRAAEPFPNPPGGLVDKKTGMISFRFGFLFEISRRPNFRIFRYRN